MPLFQPKPLVTLVLFSLTSMAYAQAQDTPEVTVLSSITASQEYLEQTPADVKLSKADLERANVKNWSDISKRLDAGITFNEQNKSLNIRGLDGSRVNVTEDGVPLPWLDDGSRGVKGGIAGVNFNAISAVDIQKGTGSHGTNALAGTVALQSLRPSDVLQAGRSIGLSVGSAYSSYDNSWLADAAVAVRLGDSTRALIQYGYKNGHEIKNMGTSAGVGYLRTKANPSDYDVNQVGLRLEHDLSPSHRIGFGANSYRSDRTTDEMTQQGLLPNARTGVLAETYTPGRLDSTEKLKRDRVWLEYDYKATENYTGFDQLSAVAYWQKTALENGLNGYRTLATTVRNGVLFNVHPYGDYMRKNTVESESMGLNLKASGTFGDEQFSSRWMAGLLWDRGQFKQYSSGMDSCASGLAQAEWDNDVLPRVLAAGLPPRLVSTAYSGYMMGCNFLHTNQADVPKASTQDLSLYFQNTFAWHNNRIEITPGVRYDYYQRKPSSAIAAIATGGILNNKLDTSSGGRFSPSLDIRYQATDNLSLYARYTEGFRAPNVSELYMQFGSEATYLRRGNPNLKPETSRGYELGARFESERLNASVVFFDNYYKNFIETGLPIDATIAAQLRARGLYPMGVTEARNLTRVRIYGIEAAARWDFQPNWYARGSLAWTVGKNRSDNTYLNSVVPLKAILGVGYDNGNWGVDGTLTLSAKRSKVQSTADFKAGGYGVVDLSAYWAPESIKGLRVQAGIMNVFDKKYWIATNIPSVGTTAGGQATRHNDYYSERGRHFLLSVNYRY